MWTDPANRSTYAVSVAAARNGNRKKDPNGDGWLWSVLSVAACTGIAVLSFPILSLSILPCCTFWALWWPPSRTTKWPALLAALLSVAAFDFFFAPPRLTFAVAHTRHIVTFAVMFFVALVTSRMTLRIRQQAQEARVKEHRTAAFQFEPRTRA